MARTPNDVVECAQRWIERDDRLLQRRLLERLTERFGPLDDQIVGTVTELLSTLRERQRRSRNRRLGFVLMAGGIAIGVLTLILFESRLGLGEFVAGARGRERTFRIALYVSRWVFGALALVMVAKGLQMVVTGRGVRLPTDAVQQLTGFEGGGLGLEPPRPRKRIGPGSLPSGSTSTEGEAS